MSKPLNILMIEDSEDDMDLLLRELRRGSYEPVYERVETAAAMKAALSRQRWDLVIADYRLPHFSAPAALVLLQVSGLDLPFIIVSGVIGEETAVSALKAGAHDYLMKGRLARLIPAIERELREAEVRREHRQMAQVLADREKYFRALIEHAADIITLVDAHGVISYTSPAITRVLGYTPDEYTGRNAFDFSHPDDLADNTALFQQLLHEPHQTVASQLRYRHKDGSWRWLEVVGTNLLAEPGVQAIVVNYHDITGHRQVEAEIRRRNRELALLNQVIAASVTELEVEAVLDIACRELALAFDLPQATAAVLSEDKTTATVVGEYRTADLHQTSPQGSALNKTFPVAASPIIQHLLINKTPLIIANAQTDPRLASFHAMLRQRGVVSVLLLPLLIEGDVAGALTLETPEPRTFSTDEVNLAWSVADQVTGALARARLTQLHHRLSTAVEQAGESIVITDIGGTILYVNPTFERVSGYSRTEAVGQNPRVLKSGQQDRAFYAEMWATISAGQVWRGRFVNQKKDGTLYTEDATLTPVRDENGAVINYVGVKRDVTRELELEEQYRQSQKMEAIGQLSGGVAHDFNNLLVVITGYSDLLLERHLDPAHPLRKYVEEIKKAGERAARLTQQLLAFSRRQLLQPKILNLNEEVAEMEKMLRRLIGENIELVTHLEPGLGQIKADPGQIEQVILNMAVNARDAMPDGGKLTIDTANVELDETYAREHPGVKPGRYVMLAVSDTGVGMDKSTLARIFEPFFTTKGPGKGTGLGLATAYGIVKQSGGDIWVYSEVGQGTVFKVYLPRRDETVTATQASPNPFDLPGGSETILLVEDEEGVRGLAKQVGPIPAACG